MAARTGGRLSVHRGLKTGMPGDTLSTCDIWGAVGEGRLYPLNIEDPLLSRTAAVFIRLYVPTCKRPLATDC